MKIAVLGGAGAMGAVMGALLHESGNDVTLIDVNRGAIETIDGEGLRIVDRDGGERTVRAPATNAPDSVGVCDLVIVFVKCYHTEAAVRSALPLLGPATIVLSLQNGWGNAPRIAGIVGAERVLAGVSYHSATVLAPGRVRHGGVGPSFVGEVAGGLSERAQRVAALFTDAGAPMSVSASIVDEIWKKLALNVVTLPTSASVRVTADRLLETPELTATLRALLAETAAVAAARGIALDETERWEAITGLLGRLAPGTKGSMLQDVESRRRTEIDVINGAIQAAGRETGVPTPVNDAMVGLIKGLEATF